MLAPISRGAHSAQIRLASASQRLVSTLLTFFKFPKILRALPVRDVIRTPSPYSSSRAIVTSLSDMSALRGRALIPASSLHLTNPCAEPKGSQPN